MMRGLTIFIARLGLFLVIVMVVAVLAIAICCATPPAASALIITQKVDVLYDAASIQVPHFIDDGVLRQQHEALFLAAEQGEALSVESSNQYRKLYQELLVKKQFLFRHYDSQLTVLKDHALHHVNNLGGSGIQGEHDHHDVSARENARELFRSRTWLIAHPHSSGFSPERVFMAIAAYKDLNDILFHLSIVPQTASVYYQAPPAPVADPFEQEFETALYAFKLAQFETVNSANYQIYVQQALTHYDQLVLMMQKTVVQSLSPLERKFVGEWGGWQSLTPSVEPPKQLRIDRYASVQLQNRGVYVSD